MCACKEHVFRDELVMCTQEGCAKEPMEEGDDYRGLVKPGLCLVNMEVVVLRNFWSQI